VGGFSCPRLNKGVVDSLYDVIHDESFRRNVVTGWSEMLRFLVNSGINLTSLSSRMWPGYELWFPAPVW